MVKAYAQPDFYKFGTDSLRLASAIKNYFKKNKNSINSILEVGAGCGVISLELANSIPLVKEWVLVEPQKDFYPYLLQNLLMTKQKFELREMSIQIAKDFYPLGHFDLIIMNPPYFIAGEGRVGADLRREKCRRVERQNLRELFNSCWQLLRPEGNFFYLARDEHYIQLVNSWAEEKGLPIPNLIESHAKFKIFCSAIGGQEK